MLNREEIRKRLALAKVTGANSYGQKDYYSIEQLIDIITDSDKSVASPIYTESFNRKGDEDE